MKIGFKKENDEMQVFFIEGEQEIEFKYDVLLKELYENKKIEMDSLQGDFTEKEKDDIKSLIDDINKCTAFCGVDDNDMFE